MRFLLTICLVALIDQARGEVELEAMFDLDQIPPEAEHCSITNISLKESSSEFMSLVSQLGSNKFAEREAAHTQLRDALFQRNEKGEVRLALINALSSDDAEIRLRAHKILEECKSITYENIPYCGPLPSRLKQTYSRPSSGLVVVNKHVPEEKIFRAPLCSEINGYLLTNAMDNLKAAEGILAPDATLAMYAADTAGSHFDPFKLLVKKHCCKVSASGPVQLGPATITFAFHDKSDKFESNFFKLCQEAGYASLIKYELDTGTGLQLEEPGLDSELIGFSKTTDYYCTGKK